MSVRPYSWEGNCPPGRKQWQPTTGFMTNITCRLSALRLGSTRPPALDLWVCNYLYLALYCLVLCVSFQNGKRVLLPTGVRSSQCSHLKTPRGHFRLLVLAMTCQCLYCMQGAESDWAFDYWHQWWHHAWCHNVSHSAAVATTCCWLSHDSCRAATWLVASVSSCRRDVMLSNLFQHLEN